MQSQTYYPNYQPITPGNLYNGAFYQPPIPQTPVYQGPQFTQIRPLSGRQVKSQSEIMPNEVSMDGSISLFPMSDYSAIYAKQWNSDGTINTVKFVPESTETTEKIDPMAQITERLDRIEKMLAKSQYKKPYPPKSTSKEDTVNE